LLHLVQSALGLAAAIHRADLFTKRLETVALPGIIPEYSKTTPLHLGINMVRKQ
jgi:hypothetical protein